LKYSRFGQQPAHITRGRSDTKIQEGSIGTSPPFTAGFQQRISLGERQEFDLRAFAGRAGYDVVGILEGKQGSGTKLDRAELKESPRACPVQTN
jgi:DNA invertase Pin-like site-specific DNA recombinase